MLSSLKIIVYFDLKLNKNEVTWGVFSTINFTWLTQHRNLSFEPVEAKSFLRDRFASTNSRRCDVSPSGETICSWNSHNVQYVFPLLQLTFAKKTMSERLFHSLTGINKRSFCWDSRSYFSSVQTSLLYYVHYSYKPLSAIAVASMLSVAVPDVDILGVKILTDR